MITLDVDRIISHSPKRRYIEGKCLSGDAKPTTEIANGSLLLELNTAKLYFFDEENSTWREWT